MQILYIHVILQQNWFCQHNINVHILKFIHKRKNSSQTVNSFTVKMSPLCANTSSRRLAVAFLSRISVLMSAERDTGIANPSVRLSVTLCGIVSKRIHISSNSFHLPGRGMSDWCFWALPTLQYSKGNSLNGGRGLNTRGLEKTANFDRDLRLSRKLYKVWPWLPWITNRAADRSVSVPVTLKGVTVGSKSSGRSR